MTDTEAMREIDRLADLDYLVWTTRHPARLGGGYTVQVIAPGGEIQTGRGATLGGAMVDAMQRLPERLEVRA